MRVKRDYTDYPNDKVRFAAKAQEFASTLDVQSFVQNEEKVLAVAYALQVIGEAAYRLPQSLRQRYSDVPWANIIGMRHLIVHGYYLVDAEIVWKTVRDDLPALARAITNILKEAGES